MQTLYNVDEITKYPSLLKRDYFEKVTQEKSRSYFIDDDDTSEDRSNSKEHDVVVI